jgi:hypothetical protein
MREGILSSMSLKQMGVFKVKMRQWLGILLSALLICDAGCSSDGKPPPKVGDTFPMEGMVKLDGTPLVGAIVFFHPRFAEGFQGAMGVTDKDGKYTLDTFLGEGKTKKGVIPGKYNVTVSQMGNKDGVPLKYDPSQSPMSVDPMARELIPEKYSMVNDENYFEVPSGGGKHDIDIFTK